MCLGRSSRAAHGAGVPFLVYEPRPQGLPDLLRMGGRWADRDHLVQDGRRLTFADVIEAAAGVAAQLADHGVGPGDRVLLLGGNSIPWVISFWGVIQAGAVAVLGNGWWSSTEIDHALNLVEPRLTLADRDIAQSIPAGVPVLPLEKLDQGEAGGGPEQLRPTPPYPEAEDDPAVILFTSGSSGPPKGAVLSHRALVAMQHTLLHRAGRLPDRLPIDHPAEVNLQTGPVFHIGGLQGLLRAWLVGGTVVFLRDRFDPTEVVDLIEQERVQRWGGVPTMVSRVLSLPGIEGRDVSSVRYLTMGGSVVSTDLIERVRAVFGNADRGVSQIYGLSEAGGTLTSASGRDSVARPGTVGRPLPVVELRIADPGPDGVGEVLARTPAQMSGYWRQPEDDPFDDDGWLRTGDLGRLADDGHLFIAEPVCCQRPYFFKRGSFRWRAWRAGTL